jgi:hypothetical protein
LQNLEISSYQRKYQERIHGNKHGLYHDEHNTSRLAFERNLDDSTNNYINERNIGGMMISDGVNHPSKNFSEAFDSRVVPNFSHYSSTTNFDMLEINKDAKLPSKKKDKFKGMIAECNYEIKYSLNPTTNRRNRVLVCKEEG